jgi:ribosomal protein S3AE
MIFYESPSLIAKNIDEISGYAAAELLGKFKGLRLTTNYVRTVVRARLRTPTTVRCVLIVSSAYIVDRRYPDKTDQ